jgi:hypothetical protein
MMKDDQTPDGDRVGIDAAVSIRDPTKSDGWSENGARTMNGDRTWTGDLESWRTIRQQPVAEANFRYRLR